MLTTVKVDWGEHYREPNRDQERERADHEDVLHVPLRCRMGTRHEFRSDGATSHARQHKACENETVRNVLTIGAQSRRPQEHKSVHGTFEHGLYAAQICDLLI